MELSILSNLCTKLLSVAASLRLTVIVARSNSNQLTLQRHRSHTRALLIIQYCRKHARPTKHRSQLT